jgi:hypothetical protein
MSCAIHGLRRPGLGAAALAAMLVAGSLAGAAKAVEIEQTWEKG